MDDNVDRDKVGALLAAFEKDAEVESELSCAAGSAPWDRSTVLAKFSLSRGTSIPGPFCGAATLASSLIRPI